jgi:hypothetical protein
LDHGFGGEKLLFESLVFHRKEDPNNDIGDEIDMERY